MVCFMLSDDDKKVREWLVNEVKVFGCEVIVDKIGNIFVVCFG